MSGALFPVNDAPAFLKVIIRLNPLSYGVDGVRGALATSSFGLFTDFIVMASGIIIISLIGSYLFSKIEVLD